VRTSVIGPVRDGYVVPLMLSSSRHTPPLGLPHPLLRAPQASDLAYQGKEGLKGKGKGALQGVKGVATRVGRALHIVADSTEGA